jgi:hypothetical protein
MNEKNRTSDGKGEESSTARWKFIGWMVLFSIGILLFIGALAILHCVSNTATLGVLVALPIVCFAGVLASIAVEYSNEVRGTRVRLNKVLVDAAEHLPESQKQAQAAWLVAQAKLETYLDRNLQQLRWIFILTVAVMAVGFAFIGVGISRVYESPNDFTPAIVSAVSGVIVSFIGASFLIVYKATMEQAKEYVTILERINAVGMAVQIAEGITDPEGKLKAQTTADIAKQLLSLYAGLAKPG